MHVDELIPRPDIDERHSVLVPAPSDRSWHAIERLDLRDSLTIRWLFRLRGLPATSVTWDSLMRLGFTEIVADPPRETVLGLVAQPWRPRGGIRRVAPEDFADFAEPGYVKIVWNFAVAAAATGSRVTTVTLVGATDPRRAVASAVTGASSDPPAASYGAAPSPSSPDRQPACRSSLTDHEVHRSRRFRSGRSRRRRAAHGHGFARRRHRHHRQDPRAGAPR
jgi:hypothetical protein